MTYRIRSLFETRNDPHRRGHKDRRIASGRIQIGNKRVKSGQRVYVSNEFFAENKERINLYLETGAIEVTDLNPPKAKSVVKKAPEKAVEPIVEKPAPAEKVVAKEAAPEKKAPAKEAPAKEAAKPAPKKKGLELVPPQKRSKTKRGPS